jgi:hypothetical protein
MALPDVKLRAKVRELMAAGRPAEGSRADHAARAVVNAWEQAFESSCGWVAPRAVHHLWRAWSAGLLLGLAAN